MHSRDQTIFALSSGRPPSAIAMVRVSGTQAGAALRALAGRIPPPRRATRVVLRDGQGEPIDEAVVLWFPEPASATGEDVAEFHVHGGRAVLAALAAALSALEQMRAAEPGEFTRRAFENGKLDLTEAEGLDDLIHADTDRQRRRALRQLKGMLGDKARDWRARIIEASAWIEAGIDFSDEGDVSDELLAPTRAQIVALLGEIQEVLAAQGKAERLRDGLVVAITGPPNVGKSTLINQLARRQVAIVSPYAGTTRDVIEVQLDLDGYPVTVIDTAGIRETDDPVEQEGVRRARARAEEADLVLWLIDTPAANHGYDAGTPRWILRNKIDLDSQSVAARCPATGVPDAMESTAANRGEVGTTLFEISAARGDGIQALISALVIFAQDFFGQGEGGFITRARQRSLLEQTAASLQRCISMFDQGEEFAAEDLRAAAYALGRLLGRVDVEDILDVIFRDFCIGK
ncbi:MAG: tRNA uridine-5-carboxymethylaminomethyl(34) synthesis GTPase MnmE [Bradyrhizobium sp.]|uniref:tRNA uridine-5-carboxymethylaminomethyl(34) synthesis GTPase MnmE n=1 Tax=Bradyrhizobium sp. TaxID=376 RepID=UPI001C2A1860|nr:tRNA uridine-5-carboxymethylaminomethyl(34) synthesis GTPase MnmE [Bradyrhizobium sp.]MBU6463092.1 tRNA uridine-5-carboxymethylaminomethyl(34) synthesis GTPase MnmE [Pseudomonadota bacterium]MDE2067256.1 tRNA uridine-5-carboxymethylaminomethyl(34) synthesis GTPase MnmE [Bradyrhizobium sp.]MDE2242303.1 tRNA uridine-5-carboxymethylaminomethyl(34) synthesis GTPase MnmE [Bradyrhizobium sp.]MDE2473033.1 tRNA uridine-5-carboxymethylaminomethyl(34) synthesis GTPase MnmE [Bradyrhizobium sp.]